MLSQDSTLIRKFEGKGACHTYTPTRTHTHTHTHTNMQTHAHTHSLSSISLSTHPHTRSSPSLFRFLPTDQETPLPVAISLRDVSRPPLARYGRSCSWTCLLPRLCLAARSVSRCCHSRMLALGLRLDLPVSGGLVEDDHHARNLEDSVFRHLVAVTVHVTGAS